MSTRHMYCVTTAHITITGAEDYSSVSVGIRWRRASIGQWQICKVCHSVRTFSQQFKPCCLPLLCTCYKLTLPSK